MKDYVSVGTVTISRTPRTSSVVTVSCIDTFHCEYSKIQRVSLLDCVHTGYFFVLFISWCIACGDFFPRKTQESQKKIFVCRGGTPVRGNKSGGGPLPLEINA
jgi:hypothetical protein